MINAHALNDYIRGCQQREFDWKEFRCTHFAAKWVEAAEGIKLALPPTFKDELRLRDECGSFDRAVSKILGREPLLDTWKRAQVGDVVLMLSPDRDRAHLGICCGRSTAFLSQGSESVAFVDTEHGDFAWRVGDDQ